MTDLVSALVQVRDAVSLIAFLSLVLLLAFRTQKVPELFFGLVRDKLTRQEFSRLLRRFMILGFAAFLVLVALAIVSQILSARTQPGALTIDDLRQELAESSASVEEKIEAEAQYLLALTQLEDRNLEGAIAALQRSIDALPSLTARETLTYVYRQQGDLERASASWARAMTTAREQGNWVAQARLDRVAAPPRGIPTAVGETDLIGDSVPLPAAGDRYETAPPLRPGFYHCLVDGGCFGWWYAVPLDPGRTARVRFRSPLQGGLSGVVLHGTNGEILTVAGDAPGTMRGNAGPGSTIRELVWTAEVEGTHYLRVDTDPGTVYRLAIE